MKTSCVLTLLGHYKGFKTSLKGPFEDCLKTISVLLVPTGLAPENVHMSCISSVSSQ